MKNLPTIAGSKASTNCFSSYSIARMRRAFTLIELIVVMGVIALLLGTTLMVMGNVMQSARKNGTQATIFKINGMVEQKMESVNISLDERKGRKRVSGSQRKPTEEFLRTAFGAYPNYPPIPEFAFNRREGWDDNAWNMINRLRLLREYVPQSFVEICGGDRVPGTASDDNSSGPTNFYPNGFPDVEEFLLGTGNNDFEPFARVLKTKLAQGLLVPSAHAPATESSELLYLALTEVDSIGSFPIDQPQFSSTEVKDTDGDGLMEFVDAWGNPIRFYRWPTRLLRCGEDAETGDTDGDSNVDTAGYDAAPDPRYASLLMSNVPSLTDRKPNQRDTNDPYRYIRRIIIERSGAPSTYVQNTLNFEYWFYTPDTFHSFLIVSAGQDGQLGLYEPNQFGTAPPTAASQMGHLAQPISLGKIEESSLVDNVTNRQK